MLPNLPGLGLRFDIQKVNSAVYGAQCWKIFWSAVAPKEIPAILLFEGDTAATLNGIENVYCIAIQSLDPSLLLKIRSVFEHDPEFLRFAARPLFSESNQLIAEPLVEAGQIDSNGNLIGETSQARAALGTIRMEMNKANLTPPSSASVPKRPVPASERTRQLPPISSLKELLHFLLSNFGEKNKYQFWICPEELCDIVEHYSNVIGVQWNEAPCALSENMAYVTLFNKGQTGENIALHGLFPFPTEITAKKFCYDKSLNFDYLFGQLELLWGLKGKFILNFSGKNFSNRISEESYNKNKAINPFELWPKIYFRKKSLGFPD